ncbi:hypothetical protein Tco_1188412 [Tanacetum coccineum]
MYPSNAPPNSYPLYTQPINPLPNAPAYPNHGPTGLFTDSTRCVTPFVFWIEDYPLLDELKMPSHVGSYDKKGDPGNYLHLFKGAISMQKWAILWPATCLPILSKILPEYGGMVDTNGSPMVNQKKTYTWIESKEVATNGSPNDHREGFDRFNKGPSWNNNKGKKKNGDKFSPYHGPNHGLLSKLSKSPREILATKKVAKTFEQPHRLVGSKPWA